MSAALVDRLTLSDKVLASLADGLKEVAGLPDPVGEVTGMWKRPNGLLVGRQRIPLGVIGFIYESRPNVTLDAAGLCLKSGNTVVLKGGKEALNSNLALTSIIARGPGIRWPARRLRPGHTHHRPGRHPGPFAAGRAFGRGHPPGRRGPGALCGRKRPGAGAQALPGHLPRVRGRGRGPGHGRKHLHQRQMPAPRVCNAMETLLVHRGIAGKAFYPKSPPPSWPRALSLGAAPRP